MSWGATAINPDNSDLYVERVENDKYFFEGEWHDFRVEQEVFKIRGSTDFVHDYKFTHNGVMLLKLEKDDVGMAVWFPLEFLS